MLPDFLCGFINRWSLSNKNVFCPICGGHFRRFKSFGAKKRKDAQCPKCLSLERHRFAYLFLKNKTDFFERKHDNVLHVAPEKCFVDIFQRAVGSGYLTSDLVDPEVMVKMNITNIDYPDNYFEGIYCGHVLDCVVEDKKALDEFYRILKKSGWLILLVSVLRKTTFADYSIKDPAGRERAFGHVDHVRAYGEDFKDLIRDAGFNVEIVKASEIVDSEGLLKMGLRPSNPPFLYYCTK